MSLPPPELVGCTRHPRVLTGRFCTRCGRPYCTECLVQATVGSQCVDCIRASRPDVRARAVRWNATQGALVTRMLIAINVLVFLWMLSDGLQGQLTGSGSITRHQIDFALFVGPDPRYGGIAAGDWYRIISSGFLHFGVLHIGFNMLLLWQLGNLLESGLGRTRFALLYVAALVGGSAGVVLTTPNAITGGASGAVFGLMAAATIGLQQRGINPFQTGIGATLVLNLLITFTIPGVSIGGHIGGAITGAIVGYVMLHPRWQRVMPWASIAAPIASMLLSVLIIKSQLP